MATALLDPRRLAAAKHSYASRRVPREVLATLITGGRVPRSGNLILARVECVGQHPSLESPAGRKTAIFPGDEIVVAYGHRYAPDQFEAEIPADLGPCQLVAGGGLAARVRSKHALMAPATDIAPIGLLADHDGRPVNMADWALPQRIGAGRRPPTFVVVGTSMNAGKTTTMTALLRGLVGAGRRVGAAKVTGTGAGKDLWQMKDAGADPVYDFTDAGFPSTYLASPEQILGAVVTLAGHIAAAAVDAIVLEVADGLYQRETAALLTSPAFAPFVDGLLFAAGDAMGAAGGVSWLREHDLPIRAVSGMVTTSPLAMAEAEAATGLPVLTKTDLQNGKGVALLGALALAA